MDRSALDGLVTFLAVADHKGFRAAARQLGVTPSAVSQSVRALELRVGAPLFSRTTRSVGLTEAGERLLAHARPAVEMLRVGLDAARDIGGQASGHLRINAPRASLPLLINRLLPGFCEAYPNVQLELAGEDDLIDIVDRGFDAGIRLGHVVEVDMISTWLTPSERYVVVGAPGLFARHGRPKTLEDIQTLPAILIRRNGRIVRSWDFSVDGRTLRVGIDGPLVLNDAESCIRAALRGVGLLYTVCSLVSKYIEQGTLEVVLQEFGREVPGLYLYYPSRSQSLPKLRVFAEFATKRMRQALTPDAYSPEWPGPAEPSP
jgi:DNA-binding transcriptional LysR family regulator